MHLGRSSETRAEKVYQRQGGAHPISLKKNQFVGRNERSAIPAMRNG